MRTLAVVMLLAACTSEPGDDDPIRDEDGETADDLAGIGTDEGKTDQPGVWTDVGLGVAYQKAGTGNAIVIAYGGYSAKLSYSAAWVSELVDVRLDDVGHVYAVKGPKDASYAAKEIGNSKLRAHLATYDDGVSPIYIVAHSSGSFVAHELLQQLQRAGKTSVLARIRYANLDGGGSGFSTSLAGSLDGLAFVYAKDPTLARGLSQNSGTALALGYTYRAYGAAFQVSVSNTGCNSGAGWCLHDVVITHRPHNPATYDLARDYTNFVNRPVTIEYFEAFE